MILFSEYQYTGKLKKQIDELLGEQISLKEQVKRGAVGSSLYRLTYATINDKHSELTELNSRCNFQKYPNGLMLRINHSMNLFFLALPYSSIDKIELIKGEETIDPVFISPMKILLSIGVNIRYARYFRFYKWEYLIEPLTLRIISGDDYIELDGHGWNYYSEFEYFKPLIINK